MLVICPPESSVLDLFQLTCTVAVLPTPIAGTVILT